MRGVEMPKRVQMTRQKPWRSNNPDAVVVSRPGPFGNPFMIKAAEEAGYTRQGAWAAWTAAKAEAENGRQRDAFLRLVSEAPVLSFIGGKA